MAKEFQAKEFIWSFDVDGESIPWKCVVEEEECVFFEGEREICRRKIQKKKRKKGVLQIDSSVDLFGKQTPFQLENGIPYLKIDGKWKISYTTMEDRIEGQIRGTKIQCLGLFLLGLFLAGFSVYQYFFGGGFNGMPLAPILAALCIFISASMLANLKNEMEDIGHEFTWKI